MKQPSFKKLNSSGIAHVIVPVVAVLAVAVVGTFLLVSSHADAKGAVSSATSAKKKSVKLKITDVKLTKTSYTVSAQLLKKDGTSVDQNHCNGTLDTHIEQNPFTLSATPVLPTWDGTVCTFNASLSGLALHSGATHITFDYRGSALNHSYKRVIRVTLKNPAPAKS